MCFPFFNECILIFSWNHFHENFREIDFTKNFTLFFLIFSTLFTALSHGSLARWSLAMTIAANPSIVKERTIGSDFQYAESCQQQNIHCQKTCKQLSCHFFMRGILWGDLQGRRGSRTPILTPPLWNIQGVYWWNSRISNILELSLDRLQMDSISKNYFWVH